MKYRYFGKWKSFDLLYTKGNTFLYLFSAISRYFPIFPQGLHLWSIKIWQDCLHTVKTVYFINHAMLVLLKRGILWMCPVCFTKIPKLAKNIWTKNSKNILDFLAVCSAPLSAVPQWKCVSLSRSDKQSDQ